MELYIIAVALGGIVFGSWLGQRKFVANAKQIQRVEYRGRLFKVYDVTGLGWHLEDKEYKEAALADWERTMAGRE